MPTLDQDDLVGGPCAPPAVGHRDELGLLGRAGGTAMPASRGRRLDRRGLRRGSPAAGGTRFTGQRRSDRDDLAAGHADGDQPVVPGRQAPEPLAEQYGRTVADRVDRHLLQPRTASSVEPEQLPVGGR